MVIDPSLIQGLQKVVVDGSEDVFPHLDLQMSSDLLPQTNVQLLSVFVQDHGVGLPVQFFEAKLGIVFPVDLSDRIPELLPDVLDELSVDVQGEGSDQRRFVLHPRNGQIALPHDDKAVF